MQKKIDEAEKIAHMRELDRREEVEKQMVNERRTNSYKEWMRLQTMKKKLTAIRGEEGGNLGELAVASYQKSMNETP